MSVNPQDIAAALYAQSRALAQTLLDAALPPNLFPPTTPSPSPGGGFSVPSGGKPFNVASLASLLLKLNLKIGAPPPPPGNNATWVKPSQAWWGALTCPNGYTLTRVGALEVPTYSCLLNGATNAGWPPVSDWATGYP